MSDADNLTLARVARLTAQTAKREVSFWWWTVGILAGSLSLISLIERVMQIGLTPLPKMILDYYRAVVGPVRDVVSSVLKIDPPQWYVDCYVLSFLSAVLCLWAHIFVPEEKGESSSFPHSSVAAFWTVSMAAMLSVPFLGLVYLAMSPLILLNHSDGPPYWEGHIIKHYMISLSALTIVAFAFFAWNYAAQ